jgi:predicted transcriptional regulator
VRTANIRIRRATDSIAEIREGFLAAWDTGNYRGEHFDFESPAALFRILTPKRWELIERLQIEGPLGVRALARALSRDVKRVHEDATALLGIGFVEKNSAGKLFVPFASIHANFIMKAEA